MNLVKFVVMYGAQSLGHHKFSESTKLGDRVAIKGVKYRVITRGKQNVSRSVPKNIIGVDKLLPKKEFQGYLDSIVIAVSLLKCPKKTRIDVWVNEQKLKLVLCHLHEDRDEPVIDWCELSEFLTKLEPILKQKKVIPVGNK